MGSAFFGYLRNDSGRQREVPAVRYQKTRPVVLTLSPAAFSVFVKNFANLDEKSGGRMAWVQWKEGFTCPLKATGLALNKHRTKLTP